MKDLTEENGEVFDSRQAEGESILMVLDEELQDINMQFKNELVLDTNKLSKREEYIGQHTGTSVEGGAQMLPKEVDAVANLAIN